ncbi:MAG: hypothetical protein LBB27_03005 [Tannerellaceae bacterium]|jgi:hypothetical protein|nr:hypothetical protein [Tannerellaceae bacterium]
MKETEKTKIFTCRISERQSMLLNEIGTHYGFPTSIVARLAFNLFIERLTDDQGYIVASTLSMSPKEGKKMIDTVEFMLKDVAKKRKKDKGASRKYQFCLFNWNTHETN